MWDLGGHISIQQPKEGQKENRTPATELKLVNSRFFFCGTLKPLVFTAIS
jgi:hypothetical protein